VILSIQDPSPMLLGGPQVQGQPYVWSDNPLDTRSISPVNIRDPLHTRSRTHIFSEDPLDTRSQVNIR